MFHLPHYFVRPNTTPLVLHARTVADSGGGPEKTILRSPRYTDPSCYRMAAVYIHPERGSAIDDIRVRAEQQGCPFYGVVERGVLDLRTVKHLTELCRTLGVNIWHAHDAKSNLIGLILRQRLGVQLISTVHGYIEHTRKLRAYRKVDHALLRRYDRVVVVSPMLYDQCHAAGIDEDRMVYIPNGIETEPCQRTASIYEARAAIGLPLDAAVLGLVGRLSKEKQVDRLIAIFPQLLARVPHAHLLIVGDGPERKALEHHAQQLGLGDRVRMVGWQNPMTDWYQAMDVLTLTSSTEGLPNVLLEGMAMGLPIAATNVGAIDDLLDGGLCGRLLSQNPATWTDPLGQLLTDQNLRMELGLAGRRRVQSEFTFAKRMDRMMTQYDMLMGQHHEIPASMRKAA